MNPKSGATALHIAADEGHIEAVEALLAAGINIEARNMVIQIMRTG